MYTHEKYKVECVKISKQVQPKIIEAQLHQQIQKYNNNKAK